MTIAKNKTVALAGGGTGGHVYPALAMGAALAQRGYAIRYYGDPARLEGRVVPERGIPFQPVPSAQYPRSGLIAKIKFGVSLVKSVWLSRRMLSKDGVDFVLGVGGYISAPPVLAAWTLGIPTAVHESNVVPGMANRLCARVARQILLTYADTARRLPGKAPREVVGCPVDPSVTQQNQADARVHYGLDKDRPVIVVVGGSLGAQTINDLGIALALSEARLAAGVQVVLVTGPRYFDATSAALEPAPTDVVLVRYEDRMANAYAAADLMICRAGSSTLAELSAVGVPSVLVPSPNVTDNHQEGNARGREKAGAAVVVTEGAGFELDATVQDVLALVTDAERLGKMRGASTNQAHGSPAEHVADLVEQIIQAQGTNNGIRA